MFIVLSFGFFVYDQAGSASQSARSGVNASGAQTLGGAIKRSNGHSFVRRSVDDVARALTTPFEPLATGKPGS